MDSLVETKVFGVNVAESVIEGKYYDRCIEGIQILASAIQQMKWKEFWNCNDREQFKEKIESINNLSQALINMDTEAIKNEFHTCIEKATFLQKMFSDFSDECSNNSEMCRYWAGIVRLCEMMKSLVAAN